MTTDDGVLRTVSWRDICPWTILFRVYRHAVSVQLLVLAFLGAWATSIGWQVSRTVCLRDTYQTLPEVQRFMNRVQDWPDSVLWLPSPERAESGAPQAGPNNQAFSVGASTSDESALSHFWHTYLGRTPMYAVMEPVRRWFDPSILWDEFAFYMMGGLWSLLVWSVIGGAIARTAAVRLGRDERVGLRESLEFSSRKVVSLLGAPILPLIAMAALGIPLVILGFLMRLDVGVVLAGLLWIPVGLLGFAMTLFAIGVLFGWPLMWGTICTEGSDAFDAISRSYAYTYQRPLQYLFYAAVALLIGLLGWIVVGLFCQAIIQLSMLAIDMGAGDIRMESLRAILAGTETTDSSVLRFGTATVGFFNRCILGLQVAFGFSFMWTAASAVYLLLRMDADQTELDDVYLEEDTKLRYGLPPVTVDDVGVPGVDDQEGEAVTPDTSRATASDARDKLDDSP